MKNTKIPIGIEEIQKIKMTLEEKERILGNVLSSPIQITKPIKSPYSFVSMFQRNQFAYFGVILLLLIVLGGGNMALNYFQNQNTEIAKINTGGINTFPTNTNNFNNSMPAPNGTPKNKNTTSSPSLPSSPLAQNTNDGNISSSSPTVSGMMTPTGTNNTNGNQKTYQGVGFSFNYDADAEFTSGIIPNYGYYAEIRTTSKNNTIHFYSSVLPDNFRPEFFTGTTVINGKIFYFGDVQTEGGIERSYMYKKNGKTIVIQNDSLIDLNSVEIN